MFCLPPNISTLNFCTFVCAMQFAALVQKYKPDSYVNGHNHALVHASTPDYATHFYTSGQNPPTQSWKLGSTTHSSYPRVLPNRSLCIGGIQLK